MNAHGCTCLCDGLLRVAARHHASLVGLVMHSAGSEESKSNSTSFPASSGPSSARHARFGAGDTDDAAAPAGPPCLLPIPLAAQFAHTAVHRLHGSGHGGVSQGQAAGGGMELWLTPHSRRTTGGRDSTDASHGARSRKSTPGQHDRGSGAQTEDLTAAALGAYSVRVSGDAIGPDTDSTSGDSCVIVSAVLTLRSESPPHAARLCLSFAWWRLACSYESDTSEEGAGTTTTASAPNEGGGTGMRVDTGGRSHVQSQSSPDVGHRSDMSHSTGGIRHSKSLHHHHHSQQGHKARRASAGGSASVTSRGSTPSVGSIPKPLSPLLHPAPVPVSGFRGIEITPCSYVPGARIKRYLGRINLHFIRVRMCVCACACLDVFGASVGAKEVSAHVLAADRRRPSLSPRKAALRLSSSYCCSRFVGRMSSSALDAPHTVGGCTRVSRPTPSRVPMSVPLAVTLSSGRLAQLGCYAAQRA